MPELRQLRTFVAVAETGSFTRAAERLFLGQQAVSKSVRALERELGVELLVRTTREVRLTAAGAELLEAGRDALAAADAAFERARSAGRGLTGRVDVGVSPAVGPDERAAIAAALRDGAPELSVSVLEVRPGDVREALHDGRLDVVVARTGGGPGVDSAELRPTPAALFVPSGHRLAGREEVAPAELDGERLMVWSPPGTAFTDMLLARVAAAGAAVEPVESRVTGAGALVDVALLQAVAIMPAGTPPVDGVERVAIAGGLSLPLVVLWRAGVPAPAAARLRAAL